MTIFIKTPGLIEQIVDGETVVLNKDSGQIHQFNPMASEIWQSIDGEKNTDSIVKHIVAKYEAEHDQVKTDVETTIQEMLTNNLISPV